MSTPTDPVVDRVIQILGGPDKAWRTIGAEFQDTADKWNQDTIMIGRILRSHLFVEHFMGTYLQARNPNLGDVDEARLGFAQKVSLLGNNDPSVSYLVPGIRRLNSIRNRLAHTLQADVTAEDRDFLLQILPFASLRHASVKGIGQTLSNAPIDVLEAFAKHAGMTLGSLTSSLGRAFTEAMLAIPKPPVG